MICTVKLIHTETFIRNPSGAPPSTDEAHEHTIRFQNPVPFPGFGSGIRIRHHIDPRSSFHSVWVYTIRFTNRLTIRFTIRSRLQDHTDHDREHSNRAV